MLRPRQSFSYDTSFFIGQTVPVHYPPETPWDAKIQTDIPDDRILLAIGLLLTISSGVFGIKAMQAHHNELAKHKRKPHEEALSI